MQRPCTPGWRESWEDGQAYDELNHRLMAIAQQKEGITAAQKVRRALFYVAVQPTSVFCSFAESLQSTLSEGQYCRLALFLADYRQ
jgi:hypothetical protein